MRSDKGNIMNDDGQDNDLLAGIEKKNSFSLPEGYFDEFPSRLQKKLSPYNPVNAIFQLIFSPRLVWTYSLAFLFIISSVLYFNYQDSGMSAVSIQTEDLENIDESIIADQIDESSLPDDNVSSVSAEEGEMEDYLIDNHIDNSIIINNLN